MATKKSPSTTPKAATAAKKPTLTVSGALPKLTLNMPLDARKVKAIQKCIEKGTLSITISKVDLAAGRIGDAWLYD